MAEVLFFVASFGAIFGAFGVIRDWIPFYNVLSLIVHLISLAALFLLLRAEFVAAAQVVVYAGAVMVLYIFVVAYVGGTAEPLRSAFSPGLRFVSVLFAGLLLIELWIALLGTGLKAVDSEGTGFNPNPPPGEEVFGSTERIGSALLQKFLLPFELASLLLLVAAVGAVVLARRRRGTGDEEIQALSVVELVRPEGAGTMKEAVGGIQQIEPPSRPEVTAGSREPEGGW